MTPYSEVIGDPVAQSKSPLIHRHWLDRLAIAGDYRATRVASADLGAFLAGRAADPDWRGCNVTMPHKIAVLDHVTDPGVVRGTIGAVNCILRGDGGALIGTNTDAAGFMAPIADLDLAGRPVTLVGTGGAARAILFALAKSDVGPVTLVARNPLKAAGLLAAFGLTGQVIAPDAMPPPSALIVNASALGMTGNPPWAPDLSPQDTATVVYDIVYHPIDTPLLRAADAAGLRTVDGLEMLVGQARVAFELLFGAAPPDDAADDRALRALLA